MCMVVTVLVGVKVNRWLSRGEEGRERANGVARVGKGTRFVGEELRSVREERSCEGGEESPLKEEFSSKKKESLSKKEESPSGNEDATAERKGDSQQTEYMHTQTKQNHPISSDFAFTLMKGTDSKESSLLETERELESSLQHRRKSSSSSPVSF